MIALLLAGMFSLVFSLLLTPLFIRLFNRLRWGQFIREDGPQSHFAKRGTPTMGGLIFLSGATISYFLAKLIAGERPSASALLVILLMLGLAGVGFIDDFLKTRKQQSLGLGGWAKIAGQVIVAVAFALLAMSFPDEHGLTPATTQVSFFRDLPIDFLGLGVVLGVIAFVVWVTFIAVAESNSVNITDGLDGLAGGASIFAVGSFVIIDFWKFNQSCANLFLEPYNAAKCYEVRDPLDLAVIAAAIVGGLIGFLWWNTNPAKIYMGDTGSLGLGGAIAALAILSRVELLLVIISGLFIIESGSVIVQRVYFRLTGGRRIFRMSPIHHHFELKGWAEGTVVVRFWIIGGLFALAGVGLFYLEWITR